MSARSQAWCIKTGDGVLMISTISTSEETSWTHAVNSTGPPADDRRVDIKARGYKAVRVEIREIV